MPSKPSTHDLASGGIAALQAWHAVVDLARHPDGPHGELYKEFLALAEGTRDADTPAAQRGFRLALTRMVFLAVQTMYLQAQSEATASALEQADGDPVGISQADTILAELLAGQKAEVVQIVRLAQSTMSLPASGRLADYIRFTSYGAETQASEADLGLAAALVLRRLLDDGEPMRRWILLAHLCAVATQYLA